MGLIEGKISSSSIISLGSSSGISLIPRWFPPALRGLSREKSVEG